MDWLTQYWPYLIAAVLLIVLVARVVMVVLPRYWEPVRHSGERTIRVVGVGGAGGNAVDHMIRAKQRGVDYIAVNTDAQVLEDTLAPRRVQIGAQLTQGLGAGGDATIGRQAAEEDSEELGRIVAGADLVFIAAGLGGGTGSGAAPVIATQSRQAGALTVGVVTRPFEFEGVGRRKIADAAWVELKSNVDTLLVIENERVVDLVGEETSMLEAFKVVNEVLAGTVRAVVDIMTVPGLINLDFADVRAVMQDGGMATAGIGSAVGPDRAVAAAQAAVTNPLLNHDLRGAGAILLNVAGASGMTMREVKRAAEVVRSAADPDAMIIFGTIFDDHLDDELRVTVIATRLRDDFAYVHRVGEDTSAEEPAPPAAAAASVAAAAAVAAALEPAENEEEADDEAPRWAAIPIVTSEDEPVPVAVAAATAEAELEAAPEPFAPWAASQSYGARVEEAPVEEAPAPVVESWSAPIDEAPEPEPEYAEPEPAPAEQASSAPVKEAEAAEPEPLAAATALAATVFAQSDPEQPVSEPEPLAAATALAATVFAQSDPEQPVSEPEPAEEPAPAEPALSARPYETYDSGRWAAANALAATTFAQSEPDQPVSELEPAEESAPAGQSWSAPVDEAVEPEPEPAPAGHSWFAPTDDAAESAAAGQSWFAPTVEVEAEAEEAAPAEQAWSAPVEAEAEEAAPAEQPAVAESAQPAEPPWYDPGDEALEAALSAATPAITQPEEPEPVAAPEPTQEASPAASAPPGKVVVSGKAPRTPEPPPSQMALRTTQAVLTGVWKRLQKPPEPPR